jgi:hypothetical protein
VGFNFIVGALQRAGKDSETVVNEEASFVGSQCIGKANEHFHT